MSDPVDYVKRAEAAEAHAALATHPRDREQLLEIAREWRLLAQEIASANPKADPA